MYNNKQCPASFNPSISRITSLTARGEILYTGLENGVILCINCSDMMTVSLHFSAYDRAVSSLLVVKPPGKSFKLSGKSFKLSGKHSSSSSSAASVCKTTYHTERQRKAPPMSLPLNSPTSSRRRKTMQAVHKSQNNCSLDISPASFAVNSVYKTTDNILLLSIGRGYRGIVGQYENHPKDFILPSTTPLQSVTRPAKPEVSSSHLLVWSTELCGEEEEDGEEEDEEEEMCVDDLPAYTGRNTL